MNYDLKTINEMKNAIEALKKAQKLPTEQQDTMPVLQMMIEDQRLAELKAYFAKTKQNVENISKLARAEYQVIDLTEDDELALYLEDLVVPITDHELGHMLLKEIKEPLNINIAHNEKTVINFAKYNHISEHAHYHLMDNWSQIDDYQYNFKIIAQHVARIIVKKLYEIACDAQKDNDLETIKAIVPIDKFKQIKSWKGLNKIYKVNVFKPKIKKRSPLQQEAREQRQWLSE